MTGKEESISGLGLSLEPLRAPQVYEQIAARLTAEVRSGGLAVGDRLPSERELARTLQVSRPSVREAVAYLQSQEIIETRPGAGSFVSERAPELLRREVVGEADTSPVALLDARALLEPAVAAHAAQAGGRDEQVERLLDEMDAITDLEDPQQRRRWSDGDRDLHRRFAAATGNRLVEQMADHVHRLMGQALWRSFIDEAASTPRRLRTYTAEHRLIYDAIATGRVERARMHAAEHVARARRDMTLDVT